MQSSIKFCNRCRGNMWISAQTISSFTLSSKYHQNIRNKISRDDGHKLIKELLDSKPQKNKNSNGNKNHLFEPIVINNAFQIYNQIDDTSKDFKIIKDLLRLCSFSQQPEKALEIWEDIKKLSYKVLNIKQFITVHMILLECCIKSHNLSMDTHCIEILTYLVSKTQNIQLNIHGNTVNKLIQKCNQNLESLGYIHSLINNNYFIGDTDIIKTTLINAYGTCNHNVSEYSNNNILEALALFESMNNKNDIKSIACMMKVYINNNYFDKALELYNNTEQMHTNNERTHLLGIKACKGVKNYEKGKEIIETSLNIYPFDMFIKTTAVDFYGTFGNIKAAKLIFDSIDNNKKTISIINSYMSVLIDNNEYEYALDIYNTYPKLHNGITDMLGVKACKYSNNLKAGVVIHSNSRHIDGVNIELMNALIDFYGYFGMMPNAYFVFDSIEDSMKDNVCIGTMMNVCINNKEHNDTLKIYKEYCDMNNGYIDGLCHLLAIKACTNLKDYERGIDIINSLKDNVNTLNIDLENTVIHFYGNFNKITQAKQRFNAIPNDLVNIQTITIMLEAYCKSDYNLECIELFNNISKYYPHFNNNIDIIWCNIAIKACTQGTMLYIGQEIHSNILDKNDMLTHKSIQINLINMYSKCGMIHIAQNIFNNSNVCDTEIYNAMIHGFGRNGQLLDAIQLFENMYYNKCIEPNRKTFILLLNACSHSGDYEQAKYIWNVLITDIDNEIKNDIYVITAYIDCISRKGYIEEAKQIIIDNDLNEEVVWTALLSGCTKHNHEMAKQVLDEMNHRFRQVSNV